MTRGPVPTHGARVPRDTRRLGSVPANPIPTCDFKGLVFRPCWPRCKVCCRGPNLVESGWDWSSRTPTVWGVRGRDGSSVWKSRGRQLPWFDHPGHPTQPSQATKGVGLGGNGLGLEVHAPPCLGRHPLQGQADCSRRRSCVCQPAPTPTSLGMAQLGPHLVKSSHPWSGVHGRP